MHVIFCCNFSSVSYNFTWMAAASKFTYTNVSTCDSRQMIEDEDIFILDVCTPTEYDDGHIEGAVLIPLRNLKFVIFRKISYFISHFHSYNIFILYEKV